MRKPGTVAAALCLLMALGYGRTAHADEYLKARVTTLKAATTAANGQKLAYLKTDNPEVTAAIVEIPPGGETGWHLHPVPVYAYMLSGSITVEMEDGKKYDFREGDAIFEVMNTPHNGTNRGDRPARLVVFYTGAAGKPNVTRMNATARP